MEEKKEEGSSVSLSEAKQDYSSLNDPHFPTSNNDVSTKSSRGFLSGMLTVLRLVLIDFPLTILFVGFVVTWCTLHVHNDFFVPFFDAATVTDERLTNEHTYYDRMCSQFDVSTQNLSDVIVDYKSANPPQDLVDIMMTHGSAVIPQVLKPSTISKLRSYVVKRNDEIEELGEAYPVSQGHMRSSFGIDAAEHPIVDVALREVSTNPVLQPAIQKLLGPDPSVSEITVITAYEGCEEQAWHSDVKIDGNAVKYARTFTHSYSFFIPLQDTTAEMGASEVCPGTQYCANEYLGNMCDDFGIQVNEASPDKVWHAGDGALISQQGWHRGHAHVDPDASERILFIVTFISRPQPGRDLRQLSRGTYFHLKWNMWGHTLQDLFHAGTIMKKPWSILRCLGLWKPKTKNWGFDLFTSSVLRIANNQGGFEPYDLPNFVENVIEGIFHIPKTLQGPVLENHSHAWQIYLQGTIDNCYSFARMVNVAVLVVYVIVVIGFHVRRSSNQENKKRLVPQALVRTTAVHGLLFLLGYMFVRHVANSTWGKNITKRRTYASSFPPVYKHPPTWDQPTTFPEAQDVLVGSRFDGKYLWAFNDWLDYHPGNMKFRRQVESVADAYKSYKPDSMFARQIMHDIANRVYGEGHRFLQQAHDNGHWMVMTTEQVHDFVKRSLAAQSNPVLSQVDKALKFLLADYRFGYLHGTRLAQESELSLLQLRDLLYNVNPARVQTPPIPASSSMRAPVWTSQEKAVSRRVPNRKLPQRQTLVLKLDPSKIQVGDIVWANWNDEDDWFKGTVSKEYKEAGDMFYDVSYHDRSFEEKKPKNLVVKHLPITSGDRVKVYFRSEDKWYFGKVLRVGPDRDIDVLYDDGDVNYKVHPSLYRDGVGLFANVVLESQYDWDE